ncbi:response regulator transcription factor [Micromonospora sp. 4G55]|uniref:response regulator transcription factor n=1 Tax=Micromonospora sp. 4G55 TaxID=2806102 RepID=UPI001A3CB056|nr:helix-turn-helix transcriptional regulator [Micromonospora sp. 4G55]MBM0257150.1 helix-turn-helix transcriptional regulator [Micromonospora sp. 4G55]
MPGSTSKDIAETLSLSARTVENHLQRIYAKLGIGSRRELRALLKRRISPRVMHRSGRPNVPGGGPCSRAVGARTSGPRRRRRLRPAARPVPPGLGTEDAGHPG